MTSETYTLLPDIASTPVIKKKTFSVYSDKIR